MDQGHPPQGRQSDESHVAALMRLARERAARAQNVALPILSSLSRNVGSLAGEAWRAAKVRAEGKPDPATDGREPMVEWRSLARRTFVSVGVFSAFVNLLMLTMPIYLF